MTQSIMARHATVLVLATLLGGCGAEVAGTAITVGKLQAQQAEQARAQQKQIVEGMGKAMQAAADATASAADSQ
ncbi:MAG: hypothetical protein M3Y32_04955 [Pseudomonadota bacterium]|nr:hypothetical protein [Pseudomonadota bacterium]